MNPWGLPMDEPCDRSALPRKESDVGAIGWNSGPVGVIRRHNSNRGCLGTYSVDCSTLISGRLITCRRVALALPRTSSDQQQCCGIVSIDTATT